MRREDFAKKLCVSDCIDLLDTIYKINKQDRPIFMLGAIPYICLVTNEAYDWCKRAKISLDIFKSKLILENIRAKAKLFGNDRYDTYQQQMDNFENILKIEQKYFKNLANPFCPECLIDDVGTYKVDGFYIGNTIQYSFDFALFTQENKSVYESGEEIKSFAEEIGKSLQNIITLLTNKSYKIIANVENKPIHTREDFNFKRTYKTIDNLRIFGLLCRINFLRYFFKPNCRNNSMLLLRMMYLTFYSLRNDLHEMKIECENIFGVYYNATFRNCMAHYSLHNKIDEKEILPNAIGYGLIEKYFNMEYIQFVQIIEDKLIYILQILEHKFEQR